MYSTRTTLICLCLCLLAMAVGSAVVNAAMIVARDDFQSYSPGSALDGAVGGKGFTSAWDAVPYATVQNQSLNAPNGLVGGGGQAVRIQPASSISNEDAAVRRTFDVISADTAYVGMLLRLDSFDSGDFLIFQVGNGAVGNSAETLGFGVRNVSGSPFFVRVGDAGGGQTVNGASAQVGVDYLLVAKFSKDGNGEFGRVDLFINPATENEPATPDITAIGTQPSLTALSQLSLRLFSLESGDRFYFDHLVVANTFAGTLGIPEPISATLLLSVVGIFALRRPRKSPSRC